jgi:serine/threonine protein kinase
MQNRLPLHSPAAAGDVTPDPDERGPAVADRGERDDRDDLPPAQFLEGCCLAGRYRIGRRIGLGGMGEVYEAEDRWLGTRVALKVHRFDRSTPDQVGRLHHELARELGLARQVAHPNVCRVHDVAAHGHVRFLTMELLAGETLAARLRHGALAIDEALAIAEQVIAGLAALHAEGIVHRDVKSANVMLVGTSRPRAVVTDFGLARAAEGSALGELTGDLTLLGTAAYMAPEQVEGRPVTARSDVYALGVVLFEMVTGRLPFEGASPLVTASLRLVAPPPPVRSLRPDVPLSWARAIDRCLALHPHDRFARVEEVAACLRGERPAPPSAPAVRPLDDRVRLGPACARPPRARAATTPPRCGQARAQRGRLRSKVEIRL